MRVDSDVSSRVSRPALGALFVAASSAWITTICVEHVTWLQFAGEWHVDARVKAAIAGICVSVVVCACVYWHRHGGLVCGLHALSRSGAIVSALACAAAGLCGFLYWQAWVADVEYAEGLFDSGRPVQLELTSDAANRDYGLVSTARLQHDGHAIELRLLWPDADRDACLSAGHSVLVRGRISSPKADDGGRWNHQNGFVGMVNATSVEKDDSRAGLRAAISGFRDDSFENIERNCGDGAGLLAGILLGNRTLYAQTELEQAFKTTGLAHLMAVSGTHLAVVTMLVSALLGAFRLPRAFRAAATLSMLVFYVALTCFAASAIRACVMCAVALVLGSTRHRKHVLSGLSLCVFSFIVLSPPMAFSLGFVLSAFSVCGLVVFGPLFEAWLACLIPTRLESVGSAVTATFSASIMTLPVTVPMFAQLPLISPLANIIIAPFVTFALTIGLLGLFACAAIPLLGALVLKIAAIVATLCGTLVHVLADIPLACIPLSAESLPIGIIFALLLVVLWAVWPLPSSQGMADVRQPRFIRLTRTHAYAVAVLVLPLAIMLALGFSARTLDGDGARVVMIDVGQGDCMLIESGACRVLIDTGEFGDVLQRGLARQGVTHLDAVILTHKDADHCGALSSLAGVVAVDHVYVHEDLLDKEFERKVLDAALWATAGKGAEGLRPGMRLSFGEFALTVLAPQNGGESENEDSLVNLLEYDADCDGDVEARGLLTGDAESEAISGAVRQVGDIDVLKVPHHGSKGGVTEDQLASLRPEIALIGVGLANEYGHPKQETLELLGNAGARVYRTDLQGDITVRFAKNSLTVSTQK